MDMIGEAVPPNLSQAIAAHLASQLDARTAIPKTKPRKPKDTGLEPEPTA